MSPTSGTATGLLVDGAWRTGDGEFAVLDKNGGEVAGRVATPAPAQVTAALDSAARAAETDFPVGARARTLRAAAAALRARRNAVIACYLAETGFAAADAATEFDRTLSVFELSAQEAERLTGEVVPVQALPGHENSLCLTQRVPVGLVVAISPFNAPLSTVAHKLAPAIAAGNAVALKPAQLTPLCAIHLAEALLEAGLPAGRLQLLCGSGATVGEQIVRHPAVRYVTFTGSTEVGRRIRAACGLARTHLELGSNSPTVIWPDADLDHALPLVVRAGYRKAGQVCTSVQRLLVHERVAAEVAERLAVLVGALRYGDTRQDGVEVGPVISEDSARRAETLLADAVDLGARVVAGGGVKESLVAPTLLTGLAPEARLSAEEAFAPVVAISTVGSLEEAAGRANATRYGLQAGVFTKDLDVAFWFARHLRMGGVIVNDTSSYHPDSMPYGGVKDSGHGVAGPRYAVDDMSDTRTVVLRLRPPK